MKSKLKLYISICLFLCNFSLFADNWIIASEAFTSNKNTQVFKVLGESLPSLILDNLGNNLNRDVNPDEQFERKQYELEKSRLSLFLQLSSEYKKKDNLVLGDYSQKQLVKKQKEADVKIKEIEEKIQANLEEQKKAQALSEKNQQLVNSGKYSEKPVYTEGEKWLYLFKNMFLKNNSLISQETITFYKNDSSKLFVPSETAVSEGLDSYQFQKEVVSEKINTLLKGRITNYGDYISVNVDAYLFPGCTKIGSVMDVGTIKEVDYLASSIAGKLVPLVTNALPVELKFEVLPSTAENLKIYLEDDVLNLDNDKILIQSGIKNLQVKADGFRAVSTTYNFLGNHKYKIEINLEPEIDSFIYLKVPETENLSIFANGKSVQKLDKEYSKISINGQNILGQIKNAEGLSGLYYIPQKNLNAGTTVKVKPEVHNSSDYIEKRRKWMYSSYSILMVSLMPNFVCHGEYQNYAGIYNSSQTDANYKKAKTWGIAADVSTAASLACGAFFGYELVRYLISANSVLPKKAKKTDIIYIENNLNRDSENTETIEQTESVNKED